MDVEKYISLQSANIRKIMEFFHEFLMAIPDVDARISYKIPFYYRKSWLCYLNPSKNDEVEFAFPRGNELSNSQGLLESKGRKQVRGITFSKVEDISIETINELMQEAIILDEYVKYSSKRTK